MISKIALKVSFGNHCQAFSDINNLLEALWSDKIHLIAVDVFGIFFLSKFRWKVIVLRNFNTLTVADIITSPSILDYFLPLYKLHSILCKFYNIIVHFPCKNILKIPSWYFSAEGELLNISFGNCAFLCGPL